MALFSGSRSDDSASDFGCIPVATRIKIASSGRSPQNFRSVSTSTATSEAAQTSAAESTCSARACSGAM